MLLLLGCAERVELRRRSSGHRGLARGLALCGGDALALVVRVRLPPGACELAEVAVEAQRQKIRSVRSL